LGTLYLKSDVSAMYERFRLYGVIVMLVMVVSCLLALPCLRCSKKHFTADSCFGRNGQSNLRPEGLFGPRQKSGRGRIGLLTDAFNQMLDHIHERDSALRKSEARKGAILESALDASSASITGCILEFNPAAQRTLDTPRPVLGKEMAS